MSDKPKAATKTEVFSALAEKTGLTKKQVAGFMDTLSDLARRLAPLGQIAESAGSMFGLKPLSSMVSSALRPTPSAPAPPPPPAAAPAPAPTERPAAPHQPTRATTTRSSATRQPTGKKPAAKKRATKKPTAKKSATKTAAAPAAQIVRRRSR